MRIHPDAPVPDWSQLELAADAGPDDPATWYYDRRTGAVEWLPYDEEYAPEHARELTAALTAEPERFVRIEPTPSRVQYEWMERYVDMVGDRRLADRLARALGGKGSFRRFHEVLHAAGKAEVDRWYAFRRARQRRELLDWLDRHAIESAEPAPWPDLDIEATHSPEDLRQLARASLDRLPNRELPRIAALLQRLAAQR